MPVLLYQLWKAVEPWFPPGGRRVALPFMAAIFGWMFREIGRQPWLIYGLLKTEDAVSHVEPQQILLSLIVFTSLFVLLACVDWALIARAVRRGPDVAPAPVSPLVVSL